MKKSISKKNFGFGLKDKGMFKRIVCLSSAVMISATGVSVFGLQPEQIKDLKSFNIMVGDSADSTDLRENDYITRAEFCKMVAVMTGYTDEEINQELNKDDGLFEDVPNSHWAYKYVSFCHKNGLVNGSYALRWAPEENKEITVTPVDKTEIEYNVYPEDGLNRGENTETEEISVFNPEDNITYQDALKVLVCVLGYEPFAEMNGGYPAGYVNAAKRYKILDKNFKGEDYITRGEAAEAVHNALYIPLMKEKVQDSSEDNVESGEYIIADGNNGTTLETLYLKYFK